jgi:hypothetical protein
MNESTLRLIIRELITLDEGLFGGVGSTSTSATSSAAERVNAQRAAALASQQAAALAKSGLGPIVAGVKADIPKDAEEIKKTLKDFKMEKVKEDPKADDRAVATALHAVGNKKLPPKDIDLAFKENPSLAAAAASMKGGAEFEKAVEKGLEAKGMKKGDVKASWDTAADIAKRQGLA